MTTERPQHKFEDDDGIIECVNCGRHPSEGKEPCSIPAAHTRPVTDELCRACGYGNPKHSTICVLWLQEKKTRLASLCRELAGALEDSTGILWAADRADREQALEQAKYNQETLAKYRAEMGEVGK